MSFQQPLGQPITAAGGGDTQTPPTNTTSELQSVTPGQSTNQATPNSTSRTQFIDQPSTASAAQTTATQSPPQQSTGQQQAFLPSHLYSLLTSPTPSVTSTFAASPPGTSIQSVAEKLYGPLGHVHHSLAKDEEKEGTNVGKLDKILDKLHLKSEGSEEEHGRSYSAKDQYQSMRALTPAELEQVRECGQWGNSKPSEPFLNVSLLSSKLWLITRYTPRCCSPWRTIRSTEWSRQV